MNEAAAVPPRRRWRSWLWKLPLAFVAFSLLQVLVLRFVDPPFSMFMAARQVDAVIAGGGVVGAATALMLAREGLQVAYRDFVASLG